MYYDKDMFRQTTISLLALFAVLSPAAAFAQYTNPIKIPGINTIPDFLFMIVELVFLIAMPIVVMFIIYAGYQFVTSGDNESKLARAKLNITWALIGAAVLLGARVISEVIQRTIMELR